MTLLVAQPIYVSTLFNTFVMDATGDFFAVCFRPVTTTPIKKVQLNLSAKTGTPGNFNVVLTADNDGKPTVSAGVPVDIGGGSPTLVSTAHGSLVTSGANTLILPNAYTPTVGTKLWVVGYPGAGGSGFSGAHNYTWNLRFTAISFNCGENQAAFSTDTGTGWTRLNGLPVLGLQDASDTYLLQHVGGIVIAGASRNYSDATTPDEEGQAWEVPDGVVCKVYGALYFFNPANVTTSDYQLTLYTAVGASPTVVATATIDISSYRPQSSASTTDTYWFATPLTLTGPTVAGLALKATGAGNIQTIRAEFPTPAAAAACLFTKDFWRMTREGGAGAITEYKEMAASVFPLMEFVAAEGGGGGGGGGLIGQSLMAGAA